MRVSKRVILLFMLAVFLPVLKASADTEIPAPKRIEEVELLGGGGIELYESSCKMDFSLLNGVFTVEVDNILDNAVMYVAEYDDNDNILRIQGTDNVLDKNVFYVSGAYEKAFLWDKDSMEPLAAAISTKCDYEIVEGMEGDWEVSENGHTLYNYIGTETDVVIPNSYRGKRINILENDPAIEIGGYDYIKEARYYNIFNSRTDITSVSISEGIKGIGSFAFAGCNNIRDELYIPNSVRIIYHYSFVNCNKLSGSLDISNVALLGSFAFYGCSGFNGTLTLGNVKEIPKGAFADCIGFTGALDIPEGVEKLGDGAFGGYSGNGHFNALHLPTTLKYIGYGVFQKQSGFKNEIILPEGLEHIGDFAFNHCTGISNTTFVIPNGLKTIGGDYKGGENTGYGGHVFYDSFKKTTEFIANGEYFVSVDGVLYSKDMKRLVAYPPAKTAKSYTVPEGVEQMDEMSLSYTKITDITIPDSFIMSDTVPENIINDMANNLAIAFYHNNSIKNVWVKETNQNYVSENGVLYSKDKKELWYVPTHNGYEIVVSEGTQRINKGAFYIEYTTGGEIYNSVSIPSSVREIDEENLVSLNRRAKLVPPTMQIFVSPENEYYHVVNGLLKKI